MIEIGINRHISIDEYHSDTDYLSATLIKLANKSLKHLKWHIENKKTDERKSFFDFGNAFEIALMDSFNNTDLFSDNVIIYDDNLRPNLSSDFRDQSNKKFKEAFIKQKGYIINKTGDQSFDTIAEMLRSCKQDSTIHGLLTDTEYQTSCFWEDPKTGILLKSRADVYNVKKGVILDIKTTDDSSPESFAKSVANYEYDLQAIMQISGALETGLFNKVDNYYWLAVEKKPPYNAQIYNFNKSDWDMSQKILDHLLEIIKKARETNKWVGYSQRSSNKYGILDLNLPLWYRDKYL